jgi:hypothetical protein
VRCLVFDSGPVISFALNGLLWVLKALKAKYDGEFFVPPGVKQEIVDRPLAIQRFKFEAFQVLELFNGNVLKLASANGLKQDTEGMLEVANSIFEAKGHLVKLMHRGEAECLVLCRKLGAEALILDERTTRLLVEHPESLKQILSSKLHTKVKLNRGMLGRFKKLTQGVKVLRSVELLTVAYEFGELDRYIPKRSQRGLQRPRSEMLEASLWALKLKGATVSRKEIEKILKLEEAL